MVGKISAMDMIGLFALAVPFAVTSVHPISLCLSERSERRGDDLLPALAAKTPLHCLPTPRLTINILLHHALRVVDYDFFLLDR
jgi:hypothetical protein